MSKIDTEFLDRVRYPNEPSEGYDDRLPYEEVAKHLRIQAARLNKEVRETAIATLAELERRWADRRNRRARSR